MGWELRHGRWYLYRNRRVNGKPVKEYLAAAGAWGAVMAHDLDRLQRRQRKARKLTRKARDAERARIDGLLTDAARANMTLKVVAAGLLWSFGFHQHHRGEWRMRREMSNLKALIDGLQKADAGPTPMIRYTAREDDPEAIELFAQARTGDRAAVEKVRALVRTRNWGTGSGTWAGRRPASSSGRRPGATRCGRPGSTRRPRRCGGNWSARTRPCSTSCSPGGW